MEGALPREFLHRTRRSPLPPTVILGANPLGLALARALSRHGVPVLAIHPNRPRPAGHTSAWSVAQFPGLFGDRLADFLPEVADAAGQKAFLVPTHDLLVDFMARHRKELARHFLFELPQYEVIQRLRSKHRFALEADRLGWPVPATRFVRHRDELDACAGALRFPVIVKPDLGTLAFRRQSTRKAAICSTPADLRAIHAEFSQWESDVVVQEWIPGGDDQLFFSLHYFTAGLRELGGFAGRKLRQFPPGCGNTTLAVPSPGVGLSARAATLLASAGCAGFGAVEYKRDPRNGQFVIIEPTVGRPDLQNGLAAANGVDLASRAYSHLTGVALPPESSPARPRRWIHFSEDFASARFYHRAGELTLGGYLRSLKGPRIHAVWN
ncbi:MAG TPA: hypothetical protein VF187_00090, partial [Gemmatimonadales bacterium]